MNFRINPTQGKAGDHLKINNENVTITHVCMFGFRGGISSCTHDNTYTPGEPKFYRSPQLGTLLQSAFY